MPKLLPVLRSRGASRGIEEKSAVPIAFAQYYADLMTYNVHRRARAWPVERAITEGYERVIWCFKSVNTIGSDSSRLPYRLRQGGEEVDDHPMYRVLNKKANPLETGQVFRKRLSAQILLSKRGAFVEYTMSNGGTVKRMDLLPPDRTEIIPGTGADLIDHIRLTRRDGSYKNIDPEKVRWFRDPHPTDPYSGTTPLESAGLSVELDHFARLYNVSFMQNDGRPGGIIGVHDTKGGTSDIDPAQMNRIEDRFGKGPVEAGKLSVIAGDLSYVDLATKPRDMQYGQTSRNAKIEILSAFGVGESVLGFAAERTFDNADNELYVYWTRTMPAHNDILLTGFDEDSEDDLEGYFDTSSVEVLERHETARRAEAREEFTAGLRSPWSYATLAGYADEIEETPQTRALYIAQGKTPIPAAKADFVALGLPDPDAPVGGEGPADGAGPPPLPGGVPAVPGEVPAGPAPTELPAGPDAPAAPAAGEGIDMAALAGKDHLRAIEGGKPNVRVGLRLNRKDSPGQWVESDLDTDAADAVEAQVAAVLTALSQRWSERTVARLNSPKQRKGTRHWEAEFKTDTRIGTKALDAAKSVDEQTWEDEAQRAANPIITAAAVAAAVALFTDAGVPAPPGSSLTALATATAANTVAQVVHLVGQSAARQARVLIGLVNDLDQQGASLAAIVAEIEEHATRMGAWARGLATQAAYAAVNGARDEAATVTVAGGHETDTVPPASEVNRTWRSRRDDRVRPTHAQKGGADGQVRELHEPFIVGDALLRFPCDPLAPLRETAGCRCHLRYRIKRSGRWATKPIDADGLAQ